MLKRMYKNVVYVVSNIVPKILCPSCLIPKQNCKEQKSFSLANTFQIDSVLKTSVQGS
jgi:hypothetical protein